MNHLEGIQFKAAKLKGRNRLTGAVDIAIQDAERYGTTLVVKGRDGKPEEISPAALRRRIARQEKSKP